MPTECAVDMTGGEIGLGTGLGAGRLATMTEEAEDEETENGDMDARPSLMQPTIAWTWKKEEKMKAKEEFLRTWFEWTVDEVEKGVPRKTKGAHLGHHSIPPRPLYHSFDLPCFLYPFSAHVRCLGSADARCRLGECETGGIEMMGRVTDSQFTDKSKQRGKVSVRT